jgi:hypothetical protein
MVKCYSSPGIRPDCYLHSTGPGRCDKPHYTWTWFKPVVAAMAYYQVTLA